MSKDFLSLQISDLADIARYSANTPLGDDCSMQYLLTCLEDLRVVINRRKFNALTVDTFGTRIEKLIRCVALQYKFVKVICTLPHVGILVLTSLDF